MKKKEMLYEIKRLKEVIAVYEQAATDSYEVWRIASVEAVAPTKGEQGGFFAPPEIAERLVLGDTSAYIAAALRECMDNMRGDAEVIELRNEVERLKEVIAMQEKNRQQLWSMYQAERFLNENPHQKR
jgi:hypothetical protein